MSTSGYIEWGASPYVITPPPERDTPASDTRDAIIEELITSVAALVEPPLRYVDARIEIDCSDHATAMAVVARVRKALANARGDAA